MTAEQAQAQLFGATIGDAVYEHLRTSEPCEGVRQHLGQLWHDYQASNLADPDFIAKFPLECPQRIWEMRVFAILQASGVECVPSPRRGAGMDFGFKLTDGRKMWIEATAPS